MASQGRWGTSCHRLKWHQQHTNTRLYMALHNNLSYLKLVLNQKLTENFCSNCQILMLSQYPEDNSHQVGDFSNLSASSFKKSCSQNDLPWHSSTLPPSTAARPASKPQQAGVTLRCASTVSCSWNPALFRSYDIQVQILLRARIPLRQKTGLRMDHEPLLRMAV